MKGYLGRALRFDSALEWIGLGGGGDVVNVCYGVDRAKSLKVLSEVKVRGFCNLNLILL